jgi:hypothetical protein
VLVNLGDPRWSVPTSGRRRLVWEVALLLVAPVLLLLVVGASTWTPPNTPDSEFYLSLGAFGQDVTARAPNPAYYWTRLGVVGPMRSLTRVFGVDLGLWIWRWLLITLAIVPTYLFARRLKGVAAGVAAVAVVLLNTVFVTVVGNLYPTGAIVSLLIAECALLGLALIGGERARWMCVVLAGVAVGWIAMCNQIAGVFAILAAIPFAVVMTRRDWRRAILSWVAGGAVAIGTFLLFLAGGHVLFPGLDWLDTTRYYAEVLRPEAFHAATLDWLAASPGIVLLLALLASAIIVAFALPDRTAVGTLVVSTGLCVGFATWNQFASSGSLLETPVYVAMLWGPALALSAALVSVMLPGGRWGWLTAGAIVVVAVLVGTFWTVGIWVMPWGIVIGSIGVTAVAYWRTARASARPLAGLFAIGIFIFASQALQNGTPTDVNAISLRIPYWSSYRGTTAGAVMQQDLDVQRWVIGATPGSRVMVWSPDPAFGSPAAMSLNGPNALSMTNTITPQQRAWVSAVGPVHILTLAATASGVRVLAGRLRSLGLGALAPKCTSFPGEDGVPTVHACLSPVNQ